MAIRKLKARGIGRFELLSWLNEFLETDYTKIEHLADGIAYCQVFDVLYRGKIALQNVNFNAQYEPEFERNFKILLRTFEICRIQKEIPVKKLVKGVFQEHFEFLHWIHDYVHRIYPDAIRTYHAYERREEILQKSSDHSTPVNLNLIPKFSMRNGIYRRSAFLDMSPTITNEDRCDIGAVKLEEESHFDGDIDNNSTLQPNARLKEVTNSWIHTTAAMGSAGVMLTTLQEMEKKTSLVGSKEKAKLKQQVGKKPTVSKKLLHQAGSQLKELNNHLELELHGRIKDLDGVQEQVAFLLCERKLLFETLKEIESLCKPSNVEGNSSEHPAIMSILSAPLSDLEPTSQTTILYRHLIVMTLKMMATLLMVWYSITTAQNADRINAENCQKMSGLYLNRLAISQFGASSYFDCFRSQEQTFEFLDAMMQLMPNKTMTKFNISTTYEGRAIPAYRISTGGKKSSVLAMSMQHAREWISGAATVYTMARILDDIANGTVTQYDWIFVPIVNLDGYITTWTTSERLRRKNMNPLDGSIPYDAAGDTSQSGVDLNRNYGPSEFFNLEPSTMANVTYPGPSPYSEPETKGIHNWLQSHSEVIGAIDIHSYAGLILTPFASARASPAAPYDSKFTALGQVMQSTIEQSTGIRYPVQPAHQLYLAYGTFPDYFFRLYGKPAITLEILGRSFIVPSSTIRNGGEHVYAACRGFSQGLGSFMEGLPNPTNAPPERISNHGQILPIHLVSLVFNLLAIFLL